MSENFQNTLSEPVKFEGIGLHSGKNSKITVLPANENNGITFKRVDLKENNIVVANYKNVISSKLCTTLQNQYGVKVSTVEHLLAALYISKVDNAIIEIDNDEVPIMDGSAKDFVNDFKKLKLNVQSTKRKYLKILDKVELVDGNRIISIEPSNSTFEVNFQLNYDNKVIGQQKNSINFEKDNLLDVIESRTFCLFEDIDKIKKFGLAKGGSLNNAVVVDKNKVLNENGLRNNKEFVNHKILDLAGDFVLSGFRIQGKVICYQGGHQLTNTFLRKLINKKSTYSIIEYQNNVLSKKSSDFIPINLAVTA